MPSSRSPENQRPTERMNDTNAARRKTSFVRWKDERSDNESLRLCGRRVVTSVLLVRFFLFEAEALVGSRSPPVATGIECVSLAYPAKMDQPLTLVTGATGYVGGRLVPRLLALGHRVRCMTRDPEKLALDPWRDEVEVVKGDVLDPASLQSALHGCTYAYYLVHSLGQTSDFESTDRAGATNFREAASAAELSRIVYLGGLGSEVGGGLSDHLRSRHEVGRILADGATPVTELRAAVVIGSGSVSFEMLRYLTEVLPVMTTPKWVRTRCQPISIRDVLWAPYRSPRGRHRESCPPHRRSGGSDLRTDDADLCGGGRSAEKAHHPRTSSQSRAVIAMDRIDNSVTTWGSPAPG